MRELKNADLDIGIHGSDQVGACYGFIQWSDYMKKPRIAAWIQQGDFAIVANRKMSTMIGMARSFDLCQQEKKW